MDEASSIWELQTNTQLLKKNKAFIAFFISSFTKKKKKQVAYDNYIAQISCPINDINIIISRALSS